MKDSCVLALTHKRGREALCNGGGMRGGLVRQTYRLLLPNDTSSPRGTWIMNFEIGTVSKTVGV